MTHSPHADSYSSLRSAILVGKCLQTCYTFVWVIAHWDQQACSILGSLIWNEVSGGIVSCLLYNYVYTVYYIIVVNTIGSEKTVGFAQNTMWLPFSYDGRCVHTPGFKLLHIHEIVCVS